MGTELSVEDTLSSKSKSLETEASILDQLVYVELGLGLCVSFYGLYEYLVSDRSGWFITGGILLFLSVAHYMKTGEIEKDREKFESGRSGEQFVSNLLREDLPDDCYILNDIDVHDGEKTAQNDHIVIHRAGIFLIETKTYGGRLEGSAEDEYWTQIKAYNGSEQRNQVTNPIQQNAFHREVFERFLQVEGLSIDSSDIHCYVAMVNRSNQWEIEGDDSSVDYAGDIPQKITSRLSDVPYSEQDLRNLLLALDISPPKKLRTDAT